MPSKVIVITICQEKKVSVINVQGGKFSKINKRPVSNKGFLGGKMLKNNKNVLDFY